MSVHIEDGRKLNELKRINPTIFRGNKMDAFSKQLLDLVSGTFNNKYPLIIAPDSDPVGYVEGANAEYPMVINVRTVAKIKRKHPLSYSFVEMMRFMLRESWFTMESMTVNGSNVMLLDEILDDGPMVAVFHESSVEGNIPGLKVNRIASVYGKDNLNSLVIRTWEANKTFSKNKNIEPYLNRSTWLQLPPDLKLALSSKYHRKSFTKSQVEEDIKLGRNIDLSLEEKIIIKHSVMSSKNGTAEEKIITEEKEPERKENREKDRN